MFPAADDYNVIVGRPAAEAGVREHDAILAIDGVATSGLVLPEVRERIRRATVGTKLTLLVESGSVRARVAAPTRYRLVLKFALAARPSTR